MIGILDSGIGGLITLRALQQKWPAEDIVYFGDTARAPYGTKSAKTICEFALGGAGFLREQGARLIVVACHTIGGVAGQHLAAEMDVPVVDGVVPAAAQALAISKTGRIGIIGSAALLKSGRYPEVIQHLQPKASVSASACPLFVPLIHADRMNKPESFLIIKKRLHSLKVRQIDTLILANPYYSILDRIIGRKIGRRVALVDPNKPLVRKLGEIIPAQDNQSDYSLAQPRVTAWVTDLTAETARTAAVLYGGHISLKEL